MSDLTAILAGVLVRSAQACIEAVPTILCGILVAGVLRRMVGAAGVRRAFGAKGWKGIFRGWLFGMLLPVCSIGVIPVARELRRSGVAGGSVLAFVLAAPLLNPISFLYGLTLSEPIVIIVFAATSLLLALGLGELWEYLHPSEAVTTEVGDEPMPAPGPKRLLAVAIATGREAVGPVVLYCLIAVVGSGLLAAVLPFGSLRQAMQQNDLFAPLEMGGLALPAFNSPLNGMMKIGLMFDHGNSVGAAFVLFVLGLGMNVGLMAWLTHLYGWRKAGVWIGTTAAAVVLVGYVLQFALPKPARHEEHTHAFDEYSNPFYSGGDVSAASVREKVMAKAEVLELAAFPVFGTFMLLGLADRLLRRRFDVDGWLARTPDRTRGPSRYDVVIPGSVLGIVAVLGLVAFSVIGAFIYYPDRKQAMDELIRLRADVGAAVAGARSPHEENAARKRAEAIREIEQMDLAVRKLMVGENLREFHLTPEQHRSAEELRETLEELRDDLLAGKAEEAFARRAELETAFRALRAAFAVPD